MDYKACYIDRGFCLGVRFSFCDDCKRAQRENKDQIRKAVTPLQITLAHIPAIRKPE